jgi:hypothetical protein
MSDIENARGTTFLNEMGDIEITWEPAQDAAMREIIEKKMSEGVRFMILAPILGTFLKAKRRIKSVDELQTLSIRVKDPDIEALFKAGKVSLERAENTGTINPVGYAKTADDAVKNRTVAVKAYQGG